MKKVSSFFVYLSIFILTINFLFYHTMPSFGLKSIFRIIALLLILVSIGLNRKIMIKGSIIFIIMFLIIGCFLKSEIVYNLLFLILLVYSLILNCDKKRITNNFLIISTTTIIIYLFLLKFGITSNIVTNYGGRIRSTLGFDNVNSQSVFIASFFFLLLQKTKKHNLFWNLLTIIVIFLITSLTKSRTLLYSATIYVLMNVLVNNKSLSKIIEHMFKSRIFSFLITSLFFCSPLIILFLVAKNHNIDVLLSYRGTILQNYISQHSFLNYLIGYSTATSIDNSYALLFFNVGMLGYIYIFKLLINFFRKNKKIINYTYVIALLFYGTMEGILCRPESLITVYFWFIIFDTLEIVKIEEEYSEKENYIN